MTTLIDALKGLEAEMDAYDPGGGKRELDRYEFAAKVCTTEWSEKLSEIIAEHERSGDWQPIETAPKDGTRILACVSGYSPSIVLWWPLNSDNGKWSPNPEDFCEESHFEQHIEEISYDPTHWQPLPKGPQP